MNQLFRAGFAVAAVLVASAANAADQEGYDWTGLYVGGAGSWHFGHADINSQLLPHSFNNDVLSQSDTHRTSTDGPVFGGQIGFNYDLARFVFGIEAEFDYYRTDNRVLTNLQFLGVGTFAGTVTDRLTTNWLATARPRLGYSVDVGAVHALPYVTGGLAVTDLTYRENTTVLFTPAAVETAGFTKAQAGWIAGAGVEARLLNNLSVKLEYLHLDFGQVTTQGTLTNCGFASCPFTHQVKTKDNILRIGFNYKLW
jgi:outer membrane immunogenic protein